MTKAEYLKQLKEALEAKAGKEQVQDALNYFEDCLEEGNVDDSILEQHFGTPQQAAEDMLKAFPAPKLPPLPEIPDGEISSIEAVLINASLRIAAGDMFAVDVKDDHDLPVEVTHENRILSLRQKQTRKFHFTSDNAKVTVTVPGFLESVFVDSVNGKAVFENVRGDSLKVSDVNGKVRIEGGSWNDADISCVNGSIKMPAAANTTKAETANGKIIISDIPEGAWLEASTTSGKIVCSLPGAAVKKDFVSSSLNRPGGPASVKAETVNGKIILE